MHDAQKQGDAQNLHGIRHGVHEHQGLLDRDEEGQERGDEVPEEASADHPVDERRHGTERKKHDKIPDRRRDPPVLLEKPSDGAQHHQGVPRVPQAHPEEDEEEGGQAGRRVRAAVDGRGVERRQDVEGADEPTVLQKRGRDVVRARVAQVEGDMRAHGLDPLLNPCGIPLRDPEKRPQGAAGLVALTLGTIPAGQAVPVVRQLLNRRHPLLGQRVQLIRQAGFPALQVRQLCGERRALLRGGPL